MNMRKLCLAIALCLLPGTAFAQSADQEVVSVADAPDPVTPGATLTYTVTLRNNGPDPATGGGININLPGAVTHQNSVAPAGFTCSYLGNNGTCNTPSLAVGTYVFTVNVTVNASLAAFPDQTIEAQFFPSGPTVDPNNANNMKTATTLVDSPQVDLSLTATDSPDPVFPDGTVTYTVDLTNSGPDTAGSVNFNIVPNSSLAFQSVNIPAGWSCPTPPSVGATNATFTCSRATWAPGTSQFLVVFSANDENFGINDTSLNTYFGVFAGASDETDDSADNDATVTTQYTTPDVDINITATDAPDPVGPDGDITYTVTVTNQGPDTPSNTTFDVVGNGGQTRFISLTQPAGWSCSPPVSGTLLNVAGFQCTHPSFSNGSVAVFTVVTEASDDLHANSDHNVTQAFQAFSNVSDPDNTDNSVTVTTAYVVDDANLGVTASDSPDPVAAGSNITYTGSVTNAGPDPATNVVFTIALHPGLLFQSLTGPAGFSCGSPTVGTNLTLTCTIASLANGASLPFTLVAQVDPSLSSGPDGVIQQDFVITSDTNDPVLTNNEVEVFTAYQTPDADISTTNSAAPDPVAPGGTLTLTQSLTNNGPQAATNATLTQTTPSGTTFQSISAPAGWTCTDPGSGGTGTIACSKASMTSGETASFTVLLNVTGSSGSIGSQVTGDSDTYDPDPSDNAAGAGSTIVAVDAADLWVTKSTTATNAPVGSTFSYTIVLTNNGPDAATSITLTDVLISSLTFQSITEPAGFDCATPAVGSSGTITCTGSTLANGASATFTLTVQVAQGATGTLTNSASAVAAEDDGNAGNSSGSAAGVVAEPPQTDLSIVKTAADTSFTTGEEVVFTITVTNDGPSPATGVVVTDTLPAGLSLVSATPSQGTCNASSPVSCNVGSLAVDASATITLRAVVTASSGTIANTASVSSAEGGADASTTAPIPVTARAVEAIPTTTEWGLLALAMLLGMIATLRMRATGI
jgi:uncharacterized repeat protein (TIGR01451 family)